MAKVFIKKFQVFNGCPFTVVKIFHDKCFNPFAATSYQDAKQLRRDLISESDNYHYCVQGKGLDYWAIQWQPVAKKILSGEWK